MPFYNHNYEWNSLVFDIQPMESWRKRYPLWPYFVGQRINLELSISTPKGIEDRDLQFHLVEKKPDEDKSRIIPLNLVTDRPTGQSLMLQVQNGSRITGKGEIRYWVSNQGYNVGPVPVFSADIISLDSLIIPMIIAVIGPALGFLLGLVIGILF